MCSVRWNVVCETEVWRKLLWHDTHSHRLTHAEAEADTQKNMWKIQKNGYDRARIVLLFGSLSGKCTRGATLSQRETDGESAYSGNAPWKCSVATRDGDVGREEGMWETNMSAAHYTQLRVEVDVNVKYFWYYSHGPPITASFTREFRCALWHSTLLKWYFCRRSFRFVHSINFPMQAIPFVSAAFLWTTCALRPIYWMRLERIPCSEFIRKEIQLNTPTDAVAYLGCTWTFLMEFQNTLAVKKRLPWIC